MNKEPQNPFEICDSYLRIPNTVYKINKEWKGKALESLKLMDQTILKISKDENIEDFNFRVIEEVINLLTNLTFDTIVDDKLREFIRAYIFLSHNINENTFKYPGVTRKIDYLQRFTDGCLTYSETKTLFKKMISKFSGGNPEPPSFRLSHHYYDLIKEK